jgi:tripartite-type tricarboxylate transporter receptor subunit TctC
MRRLFTTLLTLGMAGCLFLAGANLDARAAEYPVKSIELICTMSAGGDSDFNARTLAKYLTKELGQSVVVTNITGAGGSVGTDEFINNAKPDGYRLYMNHGTLHSTTAFGILQYSYFDMEPITIFGWGTGEVITVRKSFPADSVKELIEVSKKNPNKYRFGYNPGATSHYLAVKLGMLGAQFNFVTTGSAADRVVGLKGDHLDVIVAGIPNVLDYVKTGEFKMLSNCASQRAAMYPDIPTLREQGYDISFDPSYTLYAAKGTPAPILAKINAAVKKIVTTNKEYAAEIEKAFAQKPFYLDTPESKELLKKQYDAFMSIKDELRQGFAATQKK